MNKEKISSLTKYMNDLTSRLNSAPNTKQVGRETQFHNWIKKEISAVKAKLEAAKS